MFGTSGTQTAQTATPVSPLPDSVLTMSAQDWVNLTVGLIATIGALATWQHRIIADRRSDEQLRSVMLAAYLDMAINNGAANDPTVRKLAAKTAVVASKRSGRPVDPRVAKLAAS